MVDLRRRVPSTRYAGRQKMKAGEGRQEEVPPATDPHEARQIEYRRRVAVRFVNDERPAAVLRAGNRVLLNRRQSAGRGKVAVVNPEFLHELELAVNAGIEGHEGHPTI